MSPPVWLITGASNGFGLVLSLRALRAGHRVIGTMRNKIRAADAVTSIESAGGTVVQLDMTESQASIAAKVQAAEAVFGRIDYLVNNAGFSIMGPLEAFTEIEVESQMRTNVYGPLYTLQAALPGMRQRRSGTIVNMSSVAGHDGNPACGIYAASKFAMEGYSESLQREVAEFGISVLLVEPGTFRTNFIAAMNHNERGVPEAYHGTAVDKAVRNFQSADFQQLGDVNKAVERIFEVVTGEGMAGHLKDEIFRLVLGEDAMVRILGKTDAVRGDVEKGKEATVSTLMDGA